MRSYLLVSYLAIATVAVQPLAGQDKKTEPTVKEIATEAYASKDRGAVEVRVSNKETRDYFIVRAVGASDKDKRMDKLLNSTMELKPGAYVVEVNKTQRKVDVNAGEKVVLWTGELVVEGKPETMAWYAMDGKVKLQAAAEPLLNKAIALFPGSYAVFVDTSLTGPDMSLGTAKIIAGRKLVLKK